MSVCQVKSQGQGQGHLAHLKRNCELYNKQTRGCFSATRMVVIYVEVVERVKALLSNMRICFLCKFQRYLYMIFFSSNSVFVLIQYHNVSQHFKNTFFLTCQEKPQWSHRENLMQAAGGFGD